MGVAIPCRRRSQFVSVVVQPQRTAKFVVFFFFLSFASFYKIKKCLLFNIKKNLGYTQSVVHEERKIERKERKKE